MAISIEKLKYFAAYIEQQTGIQYHEANSYQLESRLNEICVQLGHKDIEELFGIAKNSGIIGQFKNLLLDLATNNETSFFRDSHVFTGLIEFIIPELLKSGIKSPIRIWSAASSTGQESYSIIMSFEETRKKDISFPDYTIFASDISERVLEKAKQGKYSQLEVQRGMPARNLVTYFEKSADDNWQIKSQYKNKISFKKLNLVEPFGAVGEFDVIFCRNVLIYQSVENKKIVIQRLYDQMNKGGFLILGAAESLLGLSDKFQQHSYKNASYFQK